MLSVNRAREALEAGKLLRFCYRHLGEKIHIVVRGVQRNRTNRSVCVCVCVSACAIGIGSQDDRSQEVWWSAICKLDGFNPGKLAMVSCSPSPKTWELEALMTTDRWRLMPQLKLSKFSRSFHLFVLSRPSVAWMHPPALVTAIFIYSTHSNLNLFWKHPHRLPQKNCLLLSRHPKRLPW